MMIERKYQRRKKVSRLGRTSPGIARPESGTGRSAKKRYRKMGVQ